MVVALAGGLLAGVPASAQGDGPRRFTDVGGGVHEPGIDALDEFGVFEGTLCDERLFCPTRPVDRATMAVWLVRVLDGVEPADVPGTRFADIDPSGWWADHVERLAELEITVGCKTEPLRYCPDRPVSRAQMATFLVRAFALAPADAAGFGDITGSTHEPSINALAAAGITVGCSREPLNYCPASPVSRSQMATFLHRALKLRTYMSVSVGAHHTCGLLEDGALRCWGDNDHGQRIPPAGEFVSVSSGDWHSCGLLEDGTLRCWGRNDSGQTSAPRGEFQAVSAGASHSCGLRTNDTIQCWGDNQWRQAGAPRGTYRAVSAGVTHSCGIRTDATLRCWGRNDSGQAIAPRGEFQSVTVGTTHACAIRADHSTVCWGTNEWGQRNPPQSAFNAVSAAETHSCGIRTDATLICWGRNDSAQINAPAGAYRALSVGNYQSCAIRNDNTLHCWGT